MAEVFSIVYKPAKAEDQPHDHYTRVPLLNTQLVAGHGIEGDRKGGHPKRQLNVMAFETLEGLCAEGFKIEPGQMGEQIILRGLDVDQLQPGDQVRIGEDACIEIVERRNGCDRFEHIQGKSKLDAKGRLGQIARVITSGAIRVGDSVTVVQVPEHS